MAKKHAYYKSISEYDESIRTLRTFLQIGKNGKKAKTILITSSAPNEGKSTFSGKLAKSFSEAGQKTLLIDCDYRNASIGGYMEITNRFGLTDILVEESTKLDMSITKVPDYDNLSVMLTGTKVDNSAEIFGSMKMKLLLSKLEEEYDVILLDSPPVGLISDSVVLSSIVDGVLLLIKSKETKMHQIEDSVNKIKNANGNILGFVMTFVDKKKSAAYGDYK